MNTRLLLALFLATLTVLRWSWNADHEISPEAAYLALCGNSPAPAYYDGPPGTAICAALGTALAGSSALGAALLWPVFAFIATIALYQLVAPLCGTRAAFTLAILLNLLPAFNQASLVPGSALPIAMFALGFMACGWRGLDSGSVAWWLLAGLCAAGGLLFGYVAWFLVPSLGLVLLASRRWRKQFRAPGFWVAALPPVLVLTMLLAWNAMHGWVHFIGGTWQTAFTFDWLKLPSGLASATSSLSPLVVVAVAAGFLSCLRVIRVAPKAKFLALPALSALTVAAYLVLSGSAASGIGLAAAALALPLLAWLPAEPAASRTRSTSLPLRLVHLMREAICSPLFLSGVFLTAALATFVSLARTTPPGNPVSAPVVGEIEALRSANTQSQPVFLIAENAALASAIALHLQGADPSLPGHPPAYVLESPFADSQYALWPRYDEFAEAEAPLPPGAADPFTEQAGGNPFLGRSALYITTQAPDDLPQAITAAFAAHRLLAEITTPSGQILRIFLCEDYQTLPL